MSTRNYNGSKLGTRLVLVSAYLVTSRYETGGTDTPAQGPKNENIRILITPPHQLSVDDEPALPVVIQIAGDLHDTSKVDIEERECSWQCEKSVRSSATLFFCTRTSSSLPQPGTSVVRIHVQGPSEGTFTHILEYKRPEERDCRL